MLPAELREVHRIPRHTDGELRIVLRMLHCIFKHFTVEDIHIKVMCALREIAVHHGDKVVHPFLGSRAEWLRHYVEGVAYAVHGVMVVELGNPSGRNDTILFP